MLDSLFFGGECPSLNHQYSKIQASSVVNQIVGLYLQVCKATV